MLFLYWAARGLRAARLLKAFGQAFIWVFSVPRRRSAASASRLRHVDLANHPGFVVAGDVAGELKTGVGSESPAQCLRLAGLAQAGRNSGVWGKRRSERVGLGGRRI